MNTLTYILNMKDGMSSTLNKVGVNTSSTTRKVRELKGEVNSLNGVSLGGLISNITKVASVVALAAGAVIGRSLKLGMEQEMRNTSFEVLFGGVDNAKKMIDDISNYAATSPYGKKGLSEATQMMAGFGIAQEKIMPSLKMIGDIAQGDSVKFHSLSLAFSQMTSTGKLMGQDLLQMINAQFNPLEELEKMTGKTTSELKDMMSKGLISSEMVTQAFQNATSESGRFHGMIDKINSTVGGQWATSMDNISDKLLNLYFNVLRPAILPALQKFNRFLDDPIGTIGRLVDKITTDFPVITTAIIVSTAAVVGYKLAMLSLAGINAVIAAIKAAIVAYQIVVFAVKNATNLWEAAQWLLNVALNANPLGVIIALVVALVAVIAFLIIKISGWGEAWTHTVNGAKLTWELFVEHIKMSFNTVVNGLMIGINKIKEGWYKFKEAIGIGDSGENQKILDQIQADTDARKKSIADGLKKTLELQDKVNKEFKQAAGSLSWNNTSFADIANDLKVKLGISVPGMPGTEGVGTTGNNNTLNGSGGGGAGKETANSIATGGTKTTHITINLDQLVDTININKNGFKESAENMRDIVLDEMTRVLSMAQGQI